jgi:hypothetical protein
MKNEIVLMAAVLAVAAVLVSGLIVLPATVQEAQANPCAVEVEQDGTNTINPNNNDQECDLTGYFEFDEEGTSDSDLAGTETDGAEATTGNNIVDDPLLDLSQIDNIDESN